MNKIVLYLTALLAILSINACSSESKNRVELMQTNEQSVTERKVKNEKTIEMNAQKDIPSTNSKQDTSQEIFNNCNFIEEFSFIQCMDINYAENNNIRQSLNLWIPCKNSSSLKDCTTKQPSPLIIHIHGGGFVQGQKRVKSNNNLLKAGFAFASINYRLGVSGEFPNFLHDQKAAIRWLRANEKNYTLKTDRIGAYGESAGGASVGLLAATSGLENYSINEQSIELEGNVGDNLEYSSDIQAIANYYGHSDTVKLTQQITGPRPPIVENIFLSAISLITYLGKGVPIPHLIIHGDADSVVYYEQSLIYIEKLKEIYPNKSVEYNLMTIENGGHGRWSPSVIKETNNIMSNFFIRHIKMQANIPEEKSRIIINEYN